MSRARVIKSTGSWYTLANLETGQLLESRLKGKIRLAGKRSTNPVVVGDIVEYETDGTGSSVITSIEERKNYIIRRSPNLSRESHVIAANIDHAFLVATLIMPTTNCEFIDRFLMTAEAYRIPAVIILNKSDLYRSPEMAVAVREFKDIYSSAGYEVILTSTVDNTGIDELRKRLKGKISLFSGNSGVGKSTLINSIDPSLGLRTGNISQSHFKGMHTTTFSEMFPLNEGGYIIDTPGIKGFGLVDIEKSEIARYFPELFRESANCTYYNCTHTHEPGCAVKEAVAEGHIHESRYISYLKLLEDDGKYR